MSAQDKVDAMTEELLSIKGMLDVTSTRVGAFKISLDGLKKENVDLKAKLDASAGTVPEVDLTGLHQAASDVKADVQSMVEAVNSSTVDLPVPAPVAHKTGSPQNSVKK